MALDEYLFGKTIRWFESRKKSSKENEHIVRIENIVQRLVLIARAITGDAIEVFPAEQGGGYKDEAFFLPSSCTLFPDSKKNFEFYLYRICYLSVQKKLGINWAGQSDPDVQTAVAGSLAKSNEILPELFRDFPKLESFHTELRKQLGTQLRNETELNGILYGKLMRNGKKSQSVEQYDESLSGAMRQGSAIKTIRKAMAVEEITILKADKKQQEDYVLTHNFEKVETAEEFDGVWRDMDGEDELESHADALDELNMKFAIRTDDIVHSVYQSDFLANTSAPEIMEVEATEQMFQYDEWDYRNRTHRKNYCKLFEKTVVDADWGCYTTTLLENAVILQQLRKQLTSVRNKYSKVVRQLEGPDFDDEAVIDYYTSLQCGHSPDERIYRSKQKREKDLSILLLADTSLSTDSYADGHHIIDVLKQSLILFGQILNEQQVDFAISSFYSRTHNHTSFLNLKSFSDPWNQAAGKIGAVEPCGYTRIGAAIRHSGSLLNAQNSRNKWLILLSDGKPNDFDRYEGEYGIHDVRKSLRELKAQNINSYALTIESTAKYYLPQLFGAGNFQVLQTPNQLVEALSGVFEKMRKT